MLAHDHLAPGPQIDHADNHEGQPGNVLHNVEAPHLGAALGQFEVVGGSLHAAAVLLGSVVEIPTVLGNSPANDDPSTTVDPEQQRIEDASPDIVVNEIDSVGAIIGDLVREGSVHGFVVDDAVAAKRFRQEPTLGGTPRNTDHPGSRRFAKLNGDTTDGPGGSGHHDGLPLAGCPSGDAKDPAVGRQSGGQSEESKRGASWQKGKLHGPDQVLRVDHDRVGSRQHSVHRRPDRVPRSGAGPHDGPVPDCRDGTADRKAPVVGPFLHHGAQKCVDRQELGFNQDLRVPKLGCFCFGLGDELGVPVGIEDSLGAAFQDPLAAVVVEHVVIGGGGGYDWASGRGGGCGVRHVCVCVCVCISVCTSERNN
mmetsp:Transcript_2404/g.5567  ORF Transcript_2404/g.5567 Transcript_2404/m.5567 type:complete len:367 (+) Transcript_2404:306-1406(+)